MSSAWLRIQLQLCRRCDHKAAHDPTLVGAAETLAMSYYDNFGTMG